MSRRHQRRAERSARAEAFDASAATGQLLCPLCQRPIPLGARSSLHHLTPRLKGGTHRGTVRLHQVCHSAIHARFTETELARDLHEVEALRADPRMADFLRWVAGKPPEFHVPTRAAKSRTAKWR